MGVRVTGAPLALFAGRHWSDAWLGRAWAAGAFECWDLVHAARVALGHPEPDDAGWRARARGASRLRRAALLEAAAAEGRIARPLRRDETPAEGDGLTMREAGGARASHCGLVVALRPGLPAAHVLHCLPHIGVVRHRIDALAAEGLAAARFFRFAP